MTGNKKYIFIRDDDVYKLDNKLSTFCDFCIRHEIPVIYAVIPARIEKKLINFLLQKKIKYPELIDISQHGWKHKNYNPDLINKYEFGPKRTYQDQKDDIVKGSNKLRSVFGKYFTPAFIPPYHGYNLTTLNIINNLNFSIFSAGQKTLFDNKNFLDLPVQISLNNYSDKDKASFLNLERAVKHFVRLQNRFAILGIALHHKTLDPKNFKTLSNFLLLLKKLKNKKKIEFLSFSQILKYKKL